MSRQDELLSLEELREELKQLLGQRYSKMQNFSMNHQQAKFNGEYYDRLLDLIDSQKRLYAESIINAETKAIYAKDDPMHKAAKQIMANVKAQQSARNRA